MQKGSEIEFSSLAEEIGFFFYSCEGANVGNK